MQEASISIEELAKKTQSVFGAQAIDKRRLPSSQLKKRGLPAYVAEYVLDAIIPGMGFVTKEEAETVQNWAKTRIPKGDEQKLVKFRLSQGEIVKILTSVETDIKLKRDKQETYAKVLDLDDVLISDDLLRSYPALLKQGMWGVVELVKTSEGVAITSFKPMQATINIELLKQARAEFSLAEWRSLILISMGYNPEAYTTLEQQEIVMARLLPLVQKNMHLMELAPKGTGKSYLFENISPRVRLISGGNVSPAVLFVNNSNGQYGLLARFSVLVLDEIQTLKFLQPGEIIGGLKGYLANGKLTRGGLHEIASDCGFVMLANIPLDDNQRPLLDSLVETLPGFLRETAFLDRIQGIIPGWKIPKLSSNCFAQSVGLKADFFGDALLALREELDHDQKAFKRVKLIGHNPYTRNEDAIRNIAAGMLKILFPHGIFTEDEFRRNCLRPAIEFRQIIWDQLYSLDPEYRQYERELACE
ncbi:MAG TPA: BREX system Lon protease-like protein BrxL [Candidatus Rifleibacterium sp.]|nr:BREX system Lon protease-like protein BrxL [Candidatus Rifleibacterium sp.]